MASKVEQTVAQLVKPVIDEHGDILWDLTFGNEGGQRVLRILIDKADHEFITMNDLTKLTEEINELLDNSEPDPIPGTYMLDISSPGADRPLKALWHYQWAQEADENILVSLFVAKNGRKKWQGKISEINDDAIVLITDDETLTLAFSEIAKASLDVQF
ncbi:ribosome maturation factor RimP [Leuconostoc fallax]|uniref:Ribosome maturation factor RimP n=1 Tax=Leuconostoc fallax TaxID=1251 RepID=A0A4R5N7K4_9LACO|nr:ribosome maturation factor RimP [Leuconostoc fallax]MBU7455376.1 ribosome maturation factor RimP [Leuconostoc fallax]MCO6183624.1 ribosome maturation factor RimP [Leuconostoc fallax]TDG67512.1 hypothetical protein C5L23_001311 [Leuconostoc fallax]